MHAALIAWHAAAQMGWHACYSGGPKRLLLWWAGMSAALVGWQACYSGGPACLYSSGSARLLL